MITLTPPPIDTHVLTLVQMAVAEDMGSGDQTVQLAIPAELQGVGTIVTRKRGALSGAFLLPAILEAYTPFSGAAACDLLLADGARLLPHQKIATVRGPVRTILSAERTLLNFLGHLSGIATLTAQYVDAIADIRSTRAGTPPMIVDTRKTTPGYRALDKYAVRCGGGHNHRLALYDGVMLKDNHLAALREKLGAQMSLGQLTAKLRAELDPAILLWLEVDTLEQLAEALPGGAGGGADIVLLDNFTPEQLKEAVRMRNAQPAPRGAKLPLLEASGGVTLENLRDVAATGVDRIAIGALTHSAPTLDVSMEFD